jgi:asparagine synthase (glutamine-hydrolysing)
VHALNVIISGHPSAPARLREMAADLWTGTQDTTWAANPGPRVHVAWSVRQRGLLADAVPIWNETSDVCVFLCGEIYPDPKEIEALLRHGQRAASNDAGHVVQLYEAHGSAFVERLNGLFCGVLVDLRRCLAMVFNDRYGAGRMYVRETAEGLFCSSTARSLLRIFPESRRLDRAALAQTVSLGCVLGERTLFEGIALLPPASLWIVRPDERIEKRRWFEPLRWEQQDPLPDEDFGAALQDVFSRLVPEYLRGPARIGMSLTGGLDSRMIMAWSRAAPDALPCYSFAGMYRECRDVRLARRVARACGQPHHTIIAGAEMLSEFPALAERCIEISDGTMDVSGAVELYVNRIASAIAPVRLTGNYGSEIVRGHVAFKPRRAESTLYEPEFARLLDDAARAYAAERAVADSSFIAFKQVPWYHHARQAIEQSQLRVRSPFLDNRLVRLMYRASPAMRRSQAPSLELVHAGSPELARLPTDRGLAHGRTNRLRRTFHDLTAKAEYAYDYGMPQWLAATDHALAALRLEHLFLGRHKFYHFRTWYRSPLAGYVRDMLLSRRARSRSCFAPGVLERLVLAHTSGAGNYTLEIHLALTLELIHERLLAPEGASRAMRHELQGAPA